MFPGMNPKMVKQAMKKMGVKQEDIDASEVIIKCLDKEIIIREPNVARIEMMGQESFQISGKIEERSLEKFSDEDVETVMEQTKCSEKEARKSLEENDGDLAKAILDLKKK